MLSKFTFYSALSIFLLCSSGLMAGCAIAGNPAIPACTTPLTPEIVNSCVVDEGILWRGARPDRVGATALVKLGVRTVVNLELIQNDRKAFEMAVASPGKPHEIRYFRIRDWEPLVVLAPDKVDEHVAQFLAIVRTQPKPLFVHCRSGQNRTGVMVAAYRVFNGMPIEEAIAEMEKYGGIWFQSDAAYILSLTPEHRADIEKHIADRIPKLHPSANIVCSQGQCTVKAVKG